MAEKHLKVWTGVTSGNLNVQDDGYPEVMYRVYSSKELLARDYGKFKHEKYYKLSKVNEMEMEELVSETLKDQYEIAKENERDSISNEIKKLQDKLRSLS